MVPGVEYSRVVNASTLVSAFGRRLNYLARRQVVRTVDFENQFNDFGLGRADVLHFINTVSYGRTPWVTTFETVVPRLSTTLNCHHGPEPSYATLVGDAGVRRAIEALADAPCRRLIAMSECSAAMQRDLLGVSPDLAPTIADKLTVLHPPQRTLLATFSEKPVTYDEEITFMLVGSQFFSKGGMEVVDVLSRLRVEQGYPIRLVVVSALVTDGYVTMTGPGDIACAEAALGANADWIEYHRQMPNASVLERMKRAHVGLLPAHAETYGFSVLEFQAAGCPVISTDVRALPEINSSECGWVIPVPKNRLGEAVYASPESRAALSSAIDEGLERAIHDVFADREAIVRKGDLALARVRREHSVERYAQQLGEIYLSATSD